MADEGKFRLLELENRRRIYEFLKEAPGTHLRALQRELSMPIGTLEYHLYQMEREGLLVTREDGRFKAYFTQENLDRRDRDFLYYLRQEMPRRIALEVANEPGVRFQALVGRLPISASTLSFHLKKLLHAEIVSEEPIGREKAYRCPDADRVKKLIVQYRATFVDDVVDRFADAWLNLGLR
ncbi:MAG: helix-turn-helix domain-containing protein [Euryarchaeota archaeon]|nr:helix-turn-helix domain-containing protein [Euryarchaeota archaeon]